MKSYNLSLEDVFVPEENLIGTEENRGFYQLMETYEAARLQTAARALELHKLLLILLYNIQKKESNLVNLFLSIRQLE